MSDYSGPPEKCRHRGKTAEVVGLKGASLLMRERLAGKLGSDAQAALLPGYLRRRAQEAGVSRGLRPFFGL
ncbi:hypothetical protein AB4Y67_17895 [Arthrobacter sp. YAF17]|uniref:hypothetical protein n=1 Tax=Arthrobacter sp. YAF17 TaxID=3233077 RepID=UPI003F917A00